MGKNKPLLVSNVTRMSPPPPPPLPSPPPTTFNDREGKSGQLSLFANIYNCSLQYISDYFWTSKVNSNGGNRNISEPVDFGNSRGKLFDRSARFSDNFEQQFTQLISSSGLGLSVNEGGTPADHSIHGIFVPQNIDDWVNFAASLPDAAYPRYKMVLPKKTKILTLDLDETLVHSTSKSSSECDFFVEVLVDRSSCLYYVFKRPFVDQFLDTVSSWYHLVIYTASLKEYAEPVVNWLDRGRGIFKKRLFRTACIEKVGIFVKNLSLVDPDLSRVCLIDNSPASFLMHPDNGIPIESWTQDRSDTCLVDMLPFLDALRFADDLRCILSLRRIQPQP